MTDKDLKLVTGALLHDIGKVVYRSGDDHRKHSQSGYDYLKETGFEDEDVLSCVHYHHADALRSASIAEDSLAYIVYMADNIASAADRRKKENEDTGFEIQTPLQPVFNLLNGAQGNKYYSTRKLNVEQDINYPTEEKGSFTKEQYQEILNNITDNLKSLDYSPEYINSLLEVLEANLSYVPSSTSRSEVPDISLFDHLKMTAAYAQSIKEYLDAEGVVSYRDILFTKGEDFYSKKAFLLASMDVSGIQKFIYTITSKNALRMLRARSFYLEILMEHVVDCLLEKLNLSRASLIYIGGGHCYMLLPNTKETQKLFDQYIGEVNSWLIQHFDTELYIAGGYAPCSADDLCNTPAGSYTAVFRNLSESISGMKNHKYTGSQIIEMNHRGKDDYSRECVVCRHIDKLDKDGLCPVCAALKRFSADVLYADFFTILVGEHEGALLLPGGYSLVAEKSKEALRDRMQNDPYYVRSYGKNKSYTGKYLASKLYAGSYTTGETFEQLADQSKGIRRIGILRADVDNLGHAFVSGFRNPKNEDRYVTLTRTAALSRQLSLFFKLHINKILEHPEYSISGEKPEPRKATIVYSGGDDLFIVGAWNEIIELAVELRNDFIRYSDGTLTLSAGIGLYTDSYPISASAIEVEAQVDKSKNLPGKDAVTLLEDMCTHKEQDQEISDGTYHWDEFEKEIIGEKFKTIEDYFKVFGAARGNSFLYHLLELIRNQDDKINFARYVYLLARMDPSGEGKNKAAKEMMESYMQFAGNMIRWVRKEKDRRQLKTAIELYVYLNREEGEIEQ